MNFEDRYAKAVNMINGDRENKLEFFDYDQAWHIEACNDSMCALGEVDGNISVDGKTLEELIINFELAVKEYNKGIK